MAGHFSSLLAADGIGDAASRIPVTVLTGFLGSGKTTLLNRLLRQPSLHGVAVIVNEFGAVGIDHDLIAQTTDETVLLANGCLCCAVRGDLVDALLRLGERSDPPLRHVLIETSGLADPGAILRTLIGDPAVHRRFVLAGVACTVDAVLGMGTLDRHAESIRQLAVADHLLLTKTDLLNGGQPPRELLDRLQALNGVAERHLDRDAQPLVLRRLIDAPAAGGAPAAHGAAVAADAPFYRPTTAAQMHGGEAAPASHSDGATPPRREAAAPPHSDAATPRHRDGISSFAIERDFPLPRDAFFGWLDMVIAMRGADLLRVKGLVQLADRPDEPLVIHGVQHLFHPPEFLPRWPGPDRRSRIVFITRGVDAQALDDTLDVLLRRHLRRRAPPPPVPTPASSPKS